MRVLLAHPGQQHSYKVATALKQYGLLYKYCTCVYDTPSSIVMRLVHMIVRGRDIKKLDGRRCASLNDEDVVLSYTFLSLCVIVLSRYRYTKKFSYWLDRKISDMFGVRVAKYAVLSNVDAVICFSMNETKCFQYLSKYAPHILRIVDCANSPVAYMKHIYERDIALTGNNTLKHEVPSFWNSKELAKQQDGIDSTQFFLAPSNFVKRGLLFCGVDKSRIEIIHYGTNFAPIEHVKTDNLRPIIRFVYVGQVTYRKGVHHLLEVFSKIRRDDICLHIVGAWRPDATLHSDYSSKKNIFFHGSVPHDMVKQILMDSDVFVFPSLTEGFSLSCLEALSCGLPVICSNNSGANDVIVDGINGYTFDCEDNKKLSYLINYVADNRQLLPALGENALRTAKQYTWEKYANKLSKVMDGLCQN